MPHLLLASISAITARSIAAIERTINETTVVVVAEVVEVLVVVVVVVEVVGMVILMVVTEPTAGITVVVLVTPYAPTTTVYGTPPGTTMLNELVPAAIPLPL